MRMAITSFNAHWSRLKYWYIYASVVLTAWTILMLTLGIFPTVVKEWPTGLVMIPGSMVAGATPMGGGAVSFPFLVLGLGISPDHARTFGLIIQAVGMTSASIFILCRRLPLQPHMLVWTIVGAGVGMIVGLLSIASHVPGDFVKLVFACMWMSFAILTLAKEHEFCARAGVRWINPRVAIHTGLIVGFIGGLIASVIGVGVEMVLYAALVLLFRADVKIAVPTSVCAMAAASIMGAAIQVYGGHVSRDITMKFLAAAPLVTFGAPLGTLVLSAIPRLRTLYFISLLCILQFVWTLMRLQRTFIEWMFVIVGLVLAEAVFFLMYRRGHRHRVPLVQQPSQ